jgi:hypothetical protein
MDVLEKRQMLAVAPASDFTYAIDNGQVTITRYVGSSTTVEIPATIDGQSVTSIGDRAFFNRTSLTSVAIPSSVTSIDVGAFAQCFSLTSVTIPTGVAGIGNNAFFYCTSLTSVTIPSTVTSIGDQAFYSCTSLVTVSIAPGVTSIGSDAFSYCTSLISVTIPSTVTSIGTAAFAECDGLTTVTIAAAATTLGTDAFFNCTRLTTVTISGSVTTVGDGAFAQCTSLTSIAIPEGATNIGIGAFFYCEGLKSVTIPSTVTSIGDQAFYCCTSLSSVSIAPGVTSIGSEAFAFCDSLVNLFIPSTVQHLGEYGVRGLSLKGIHFYGNAPQVPPNALIHGNGVTVYYLPGTSGWTSQFQGVDAAVFPDSMAPTAVAGIRGNGQVQLSWTAPVSNGGLTVTDYTIQYSSDSGSSWQTFTDAVSSATSATVTGLNNGIGYLFRVASVNDVGTGLYSANSSAVTPATTPGLPTAVAGIRGNGQVQLSWAAPVSNGGLPVTDYTIQYSSNSGSSWQTVSRTASTATSATVTGLRNGTAYLFRLTSVNDVGMGSFSTNSSRIIPNAVPLPPTNIVSTRGRGIVIVSWTAPVSTGGVRITDYRVQQSTNGGLSWVTVRDGVSTSTRTVVSGLVMGRDYIFRVAAVGRFGAGDSSSPSRVVVPATVPSVPVGLLATGGIGQVALSWRAPTSTGGSPINQYIVQYSPSVGRWITSTTVGSNTTTATVSGLLANRPYSFRVLAVNDMGNSLSSRVVVARTLRPALVRV